MNEPTPYVIRIHLASGTEIETTVEYDEPDLSATEVAEDLHMKISGTARWKQLEHLVLFTGAISAIEVIDI